MIKEIIAWYDGIEFEDELHRAVFLDMIHFFVSRETYLELVNELRRRHNPDIS